MFKSIIFTVLKGVLVFFILNCHSFNVSGVSMMSVGAHGDGINDDTGILIRLINDSTIKEIVFDKDHSFLISPVNLRSDLIVKIEGTILIGFSPIYDSDQVKIYNLFFAKDIRNLSIVGAGKIDGSRLKNLSNLKFSFVKISRGYNIRIENIHFVSNPFPINAHTSITTGMVHFIDCKKVSISSCLFEDWGREALWLENTSNSSIKNSTFIGGQSSWSAIQISGNKNLIDNCFVRNSGASGISFDSKNSIIKNCIVYDNRFFHGFNFGHKGMPTINSSIINCLSINSSANGFNFGFGSRNNKVLRSSVVNAKRVGFNISNNATDIKLNHVKVDGAVDAVKIYKSKVIIRNISFKGIRNKEIHETEN